MSREQGGIIIKTLCQLQEPKNKTMNRQCAIPLISRVIIIRDISQLLPLNHSRIQCQTMASPGLLSSLLPKLICSSLLWLFSHSLTISSSSCHRAIRDAQSRTACYIISKSTEILFLITKEILTKEACYLALSEIPRKVISWHIGRKIYYALNGINVWKYWKSKTDHTVRNVHNFYACFGVYPTV